MDDLVSTAKQERKVNPTTMNTGIPVLAGPTAPTARNDATSFLGQQKVGVCKVTHVGQITIYNRSHRSCRSCRSSRA